MLTEFMLKEEVNASLSTFEYIIKRFTHFYYVKIYPIVVIIIFQCVLIPKDLSYVIVMFQYVSILKDLHHFQPFKQLMKILRDRNVLKYYYSNYLLRKVINIVLYPFL